MLPAKLSRQIAGTLQTYRYECRGTPFELNRGAAEVTRKGSVPPAMVSL
jgi:hypothetical protein